MPRLALYQPDIPQNTGTILRLAACLGVPVDIIEPAGFDVSDRNFRRAGLDYLNDVEITRHASWRAFDAWHRARAPRLILATTRGVLPYTEFAFARDDVIVLGRESAGVPDEVHRAADACLVIPLRGGLRSLNVAVAAAMILGEALRQTGSFPVSLPEGESLPLGSDPRVGRSEGAPGAGETATSPETATLSSPLPPRDRKKVAPA